MSKPINGRGSKNVALHSKGDGAPPEILDSAGTPVSVMFQELCLLPRYDDHFVQANTCVVRGRYGGTVLRCSNTAVVDYDSNIYALRIVQDAAAAEGHD